MSEHNKLKLLGPPFEIRNWKAVYLGPVPVGRLTRDVYPGWDRARGQQGQHYDFTPTVEGRSAGLKHFRTQYLKDAKAKLKAQLKAD